MLHLPLAGTLCGRPSRHRRSHPWLPEEFRNLGAHRRRWWLWFFWAFTAPCDDAADREKGVCGRFEGAGAVLAGGIARDGAPRPSLTTGARSSGSFSPSSSRNGTLLSPRPIGLS